MLEQQIIWLLLTMIESIINTVVTIDKNMVVTMMVNHSLEEVAGDSFSICFTTSPLSDLLVHRICLAPPKMQRFWVQCKSFRVYWWFLLAFSGDFWCLEWELRGNSVGFSTLGTGGAGPPHRAKRQRPSLQLLQQHRLRVLTMQMQRQKGGDTFITILKPSMEFSFFNHKEFNFNHGV